MWPQPSRAICPHRLERRSRSFRSSAPVKASLPLVVQPLCCSQLACALLRCPCSVQRDRWWGLTSTAQSAYSLECMLLRLASHSRRRIAAINSAAFASTGQCRWSEFLGQFVAEVCFGQAVSHPFADSHLEQFNVRKLAEHNILLLKRGQSAHRLPRAPELRHGVRPRQL